MGLLDDYFPSRWGGLLATPLDPIPPRGPNAPFLIPAAEGGPGNSRATDLPSGTMAPEAADHGLSERRKLSPWQLAVNPVTSYPETYRRMNREALGQISRGFDQFAQPEADQNDGPASGSEFDAVMPHGLSNIAKGAGNVASGTLGYVASPITAAYRSLIGQPIEDITGIPREYAEAAAQLATPAIGLLRGPGRPVNIPSRAINAPAEAMPEAQGGGGAARNVADTAGRVASNGAGASDANTMHVPYEAIPSRDSGHLAGLEGLPQRVQDAYSREFNFGHGPGGSDTVYHALGMPQLPTAEAQGFWRLPDGTVQQNVANVAKPQFPRVAANATGIDADSARLAELAENLRAYGAVQDGVGGQLLTRGKSKDMNTISIPVPNGITREQMLELKRRATPYGLPDISDIGGTVNLTRFGNAGPDGREIGEYLRRGMSPRNQERIGPNLPPLANAIRDTIPDAGPPLRVSRSGPFIDYSAELKAAPGSRIATGKFLGAVDAAPADLVGRLNASTQIPKDFLAMADRDHAFAAAHGLPIRDDIQNMRRMVGEGPGYIDRLRAAYARGAYLPAGVPASLAAGAAANEDQSYSSQNRR